MSNVRFTFLPLAGDVGLPTAAASLDGFIPEGFARAVHDFGVLDAAAFAQRKGGQVPERAAVDDDVRKRLRELGHTDLLALFDAGCELWQQHRGDVTRALDADQERTKWAARRQVTDSPEARRQLRSWSQATNELLPLAVGFADRAAITINDAAAGVMTPPEEPIRRRRVVPSWR